MAFITYNHVGIRAMAACVPSRRVSNADLGYLIPPEEIDKMIAERAERTKKTVEEIREKTNIPALKRTEAIRRAADWVIERSTIEEK